MNFVSENRRIEGEEVEEEEEEEEEEKEKNPGSKEVFH
jgi:hypothetical protein